MSKRKKIVLILLSTLVLAFAAGGVFGYKFYTLFRASNIRTEGSLYVPTGADYRQVLDSLFAGNFLKDTASFLQTAKLKGFTAEDKIYPGRYKITKNLANAALVNKLQAGMQDPVRVTFNSVRTKAAFAGKIAAKIEADSLGILLLLNDEVVCQDFGFDTANIIGMFLPDTYEMYWNTSARDFITKMSKEYSKFWTNDRKVKADSLSLTFQEVSVLASVVQAEQLQFSKERPTIAGLYLNRLKIDMPLQSDPTLIFALGDFTKKRVLDADKEVDSPYNTYKNTGLPPGPILMPDKSSLDAVLDYERNDYLFMCAKEDFSGFHNFAKDLSQHLIYARKYQDALNKAKIYK